MSAIYSSLARRLPGASCSSSAPCPSRTTRIGGPRSVQRQATYDPENLFKALPPATGIIEKRLASKNNKEYAAQMQRATDDMQKVVLTRRAARAPPPDHTEFIEYLLNTQAEDMEYEVARCRPQLTPEFFKQLDTVVGRERFAAKPNEERIAELDMLRQYLTEAVEAVDKCVEKTASAAERVKKLLSAPDKKQMILDMAADNEIDQALMDLLQQNIEAAKAAEQDKAAEFMEKVKVAAGKYFVKVA